MKRELHFEVRRKSFHLLCLIFPFVYVLLRPYQMQAVLIVITAIAIILDTSRHYSTSVDSLVQKTLGHIIRPHEKSGSFSLSGSSYMALGFLLSSLIGEKEIVIASWCVLAVADTMASLMGIYFTSGNGKSMIGTISFFLSAVIVSILAFEYQVYEIKPFGILIASLTATLFEYFSKTIKIDDNLSIPVIFVLAYSLF